MCRSSTSSSDRRRAGRFLLRALVFLAPALLLWVPVEILLFRAGETLPAATVARQQLELDQSLYGRGLLSQQYNTYKLAAVALRRPRVLIAGSSRALQLRASCFGALAPDTYNGGGLLRDLDDVEALVDRLLEVPDYMPAYLLLTLDPWWFRQGGLHRDSWLVPPHTDDEAYSVVARISALRRLIKEPALLALAAEGPGLERGVTLIGLSAARGNGFRPDGSYRYGSHLRAFARNPVYVDREHPPIIERIRKLRSPFEASNGVDPARVARLVGAIARLKAAGVEVGVIVPPLTRECASAAREEPKLWAWLLPAFVDVARQLRAHGIAVVSEVTMEGHGLDDRHFFDGFHPGEVAMGHLLADLVEASGPSSILAGVSARDLRATLRNASTALTIHAIDALP